MTRGSGRGSRSARPLGWQVPVAARGALRLAGRGPGPAATCQRRRGGADAGRRQAGRVARRSRSVTSPLRIRQQWGPPDRISARTAPSPPTTPPQTGRRDPGCGKVKAARRQRRPRRRGAPAAASGGHWLRLHVAVATGWPAGRQPWRRSGSGPLEAAAGNAWPWRRMTRSGDVRSREVVWLLRGREGRGAAGECAQQELLLWRKALSNEEYSSVLKMESVRINHTSD